MTERNFDDALRLFFEGVKNISCTNHLQRAKFDIVQLKRYWRVEREGSAHCFVDKETGDVLKAASWSKPAKHARGNIFNPDYGLGNMGPHGPAYLR
jgi:hypothetical protein